MRISGNEHSSLILSQKSSLKVANGGSEVPKQAKDKRDGVINPQNYNFNFQYGKLWCSQNAKNQPKSTVELGYMCPRDSLVHQQWHSPSSWNIKRGFYSDVYTILYRI